MGGFISNYFHQFYDTRSIPRRARGRELEQRLARARRRGSRTSSTTTSASRARLEMILTSTKGTGDSAQIYGLGGQVIAAVSRGA